MNKDLLRDKLIIRSKCGSISFFVVALYLPLLFLLFTLSLDLATYYRQSENLQQTLDDAALYAYRFLPFKAEAERALKTYLAKEGDLSKYVKINMEDDTLSLLLDSSVDLTFAKLLGVEAPIPIQAYSKVRGTVFDALVVLDTSAYMAPSNLMSAAGTWGDSSWRPASFFLDMEPPLIKDGVEADPLKLTQRCFNPALNPLKLSAIKTYEYLSAFKLNGVGLGFYPGTGVFMDTARYVSSVREGGEAELPFDPGVGLVRASYCAAISESAENAGLTHYQLPGVNSDMASSYNADSGPINLLSYTPLSFNPEYAPFFSARQAVWYRPIADRDFTHDFSGVLSEVRAQLVGTPSGTERGGLTNKAVKSAIIFAGDVPWIADEVRGYAFRFPADEVKSSLLTEIELLKNIIAQEGTNFKLYYVALEHEGKSDLQSLVPELRDFFREASIRDGKEIFNVQVMLGSDGDKLSQEVVGSMVLDRKSAVLAR